MNGDTFKTSLHDFRAAVFKKHSAPEKNDMLRHAAQERLSSAVVGQIIAAFPNKEEIDREHIVTATSYGHTAMVDLLTDAIPVPQAQEYYDRALIAAAVSHLAPEESYADIADILIRKGADNTAFDGQAISMAHDYHEKTLVLAVLLQEKGVIGQKHRKPSL